MLLLHLACFEPNTRPYEMFLQDLALETDADVDADTDTDADADADTDADADADTDTGFTTCSMPVGDGRMVLFVNQTGVPIDLYYITSECEALNVVLMGAGDSSERFTSEGDVWRAWNVFGGGGYIASVTVDATSSELAVGP